MLHNSMSEMLGTWDYTSCTESLQLAVCQHYAGKPPLLALYYQNLLQNMHVYLEINV